MLHHFCIISHQITPISRPNHAHQTHITPISRPYATHFTPNHVGSISYSCQAIRRTSHISCASQPYHTNIMLHHFCITLHQITSISRPHHAHHTYNSHITPTSRHITLVLHHNISHQYHGRDMNITPISH